MRVELSDIESLLITDRLAQADALVAQARAEADAFVGAAVGAVLGAHGLSGQAEIVVEEGRAKALKVNGEAGSGEATPPPDGSFPVSGREHDEDSPDA